MLQIFPFSVETTCLHLPFSLHSTGSVTCHLWCRHVECFVWFPLIHFSTRGRGKYYWQLWELTRREENIIANISLIIARLHRQVLTRFFFYLPIPLFVCWQLQYFKISTVKSKAYFCNTEQIPNILLLTTSEKKYLKFKIGCDLFPTDCQYTTSVRHLLDLREQMWGR